MPRAQRGKAKFAQICAACHGADGKGNQALGAPNLTDKIWLHGGGEDGHRRDHQQGPQRARCRRTRTCSAPAKIHLLAAYVYALSPVAAHAACEVAPASRHGAACRQRRGLRRPTTTPRASSRSTRSARQDLSARGAAAGSPRWRWALVWATQLVFYGRPWLQWNGRQAVLFDLVARKFYIFGLVFWPQDFIYLTGLLIISALVAVPVHRGGRAAVVRLRLPADGLHRDLHVDRAQDRGRPQRAHEARREPWIAAQGSGARRPSTASGSRSRCGPASPSSATSRRSASCWRRGRRRSRLGRGRPSGSCSTASPPTATPAGCASRCASTCAPTRASRARCSTGTR